MLRNYFLMAAACVVGCAAISPALSAAETPTITISKSDSIALALTPIAGTDGPAVAKVLQNDLTLAGYFSLTSSGKAAITVSGSDGAGSLQGKATDAAGGTVLMRSYTGTAREKAHAFANDIIETLTGNRGIAASKIAFVATRTGRKELYTADYDGSNVRQVTHDGSISVAPALSPDGRRVAYTSYLKGYADVYSIDLASGARERIVKFPGTNSGAAFSPDGSRIACSVSKDGNPELYVMRADGSGARRLTRTPGVESSPSWSPDGQDIVYNSDDRGTPQLYRISASGGAGRLLSTGYRYCTEPSWSPDGKKIAFNVREGGSFRIAVLDVASNAARILGAAGEDARDPVWGPDSRHLLFTQGGSLLLLDVQNGRRVKVLDGLGSISEPSWSH